MNMSYCRFQNTKGDLSACLDAIRSDECLSDSEAAAGKRMFREFLTLCWDFGIIDGYDGERVNEVFDDLTGDEEDENDE